jgi:hypothetical protein
VLPFVGFFFFGISWFRHDDQYTQLAFLLTCSTCSISWSSRSRSSPPGA